MCLNQGASGHRVLSLYTPGGTPSGFEEKKRRGWAGGAEERVISSLFLIADGSHRSVESHKNSAQLLILRGEGYAGRIKI